MGGQEEGDSRLDSMGVVLNTITDIQWYEGERFGGSPPYLSTNQELFKKFKYVLLFDRKRECWSVVTLLKNEDRTYRIFGSRVYTALRYDHEPTYSEIENDMLKAQQSMRQKISELISEVEYKKLKEHERNREELDYVAREIERGRRLYFI